MSLEIECFSEYSLASIRTIASACSRVGEEGKLRVSSSALRSRTRDETYGVEHELGESLGEKSLSRSRGTAEEEGGDGSIEVSES